MLLRPTLSDSLPLSVIYLGYFFITQGFSNVNTTKVGFCLIILIISLAPHDRLFEFTAENLLSLSGGCKLPERNALPGREAPKDLKRYLNPLALKT